MDSYIQMRVVKKQLNYTNLVILNFKQLSIGVFDLHCFWGTLRHLVFESYTTASKTLKCSEI
jgi:hypothetical protein